MDSHMIVNAWLLEYAASRDYTLTVHELATKLYGQDETCTRSAPCLNLHMAACVVKANIINPVVKYFDVIIEAVNWLYEATGDVIQFKHFAKVFAGLKQWALLESLRLGDKLILPRLNQYFPRNVVVHPKAEPKMVKLLETGQSHFRKFFLPLIADQKYRTSYFSEHYEQDYGPLFFGKLAKFSLDFVEKIRKALPPPIIDRLIKAGTDSLIAQQLSQRGGVAVDILLDALVGKTELSEDDIRDVMNMLQPSHNAPPDIFTIDSNSDSETEKNMVADIMMVSRVTTKKQLSTQKTKSSANRGKSPKSPVNEGKELDDSEDEDEEEEDDEDDEDEEDSDEFDDEEESDVTQSSDAQTNLRGKRKDADWEPPSKKKAISTAQKRRVEESSSSEDEDEDSSDDPEIIITPRQTRNQILRRNHKSPVQKTISPGNSKNKSKNRVPSEESDSDSDVEMLCTPADKRKSKAVTSRSTASARKSKTMVSRSTASVQKSASKGSRSTASAHKSVSKPSCSSSEESDISDDENDPVVTRRKRQESDAPRSARRTVKRSILGDLSSSRTQNSSPAKATQKTQPKDNRTPVKGTNGNVKGTPKRGTPKAKLLSKSSVKSVTPLKTKNTPSTKSSAKMSLAKKRSDAATPSRVKSTPQQSPSRKTSTSVRKSPSPKSTPVKRKLTQSGVSPSAAKKSSPVSKTGSPRKSESVAKRFESPRKRAKLTTDPESPAPKRTPNKPSGTPKRGTPSRKAKTPASAASGNDAKKCDVVIPPFSFYQGKASSVGVGAAVTVAVPVIEISSDESESEYESCEEELPSLSPASSMSMQTAPTHLSSVNEGGTQKSTLVDDVDLYVSSSDKESDNVSDIGASISDRLTLENSTDSDDIIPSSVRKQVRIPSVDSVDSPPEKSPQEIRRLSYPSLLQHRRPPQTKLCVIKLFHEPGQEYRIGESRFTLFS